MGDTHGPEWATVAAAVPQQARSERERSFWQELVRAWRWRRVVDAGCGAGLHLGVLGELGVAAVGFDLALSALVAGGRRDVAAGDLLAPPLREARWDGVLCLGNTFSLLADRSAQRLALGRLAGLLRPGGTMLLQGEDAGALVAASPVVRTRGIEPASVHVRVFERRGKRVHMLAGVAPVGSEAQLSETWLLPTTAASVATLGGRLGLAPVRLPAPPPAGAGWWVALTAAAVGSRAPRETGTDSRLS
ncbi:MAG: methyltransferase domain-containing protein [Acidobacteriota bacterium]